MTDPTPPAPTSPPVVSFRARLVLDDEHGFALRPDEEPLPTSWTLTFGLGGPAERTYSEVRFAPEVLGGLAEHPDEHARERLLDEVVRRVAVAAYGTAWAFHYRPEEYARSVHGEGKWPAPRRREILFVDRIEVYL